MNVLYVEADNVHGKIVTTASGFELSGFARYQEIVVTDPEDVYGDPLYVGQAHMAASVLPVGTYWWEPVDDNDFTD